MGLYDGHVIRQQQIERNRRKRERGEATEPVEPLYTTPEDPHERGRQYLAEQERERANTAIDPKTGDLYEKCGSEGYIPKRDKAGNPERTRIPGFGDVIPLGPAGMPLPPKNRWL